MKNLTIAAIVFISIFLTITIPSNAFGAPAHDGGTVFRDVEGKEWILSEFRSVTSSGSVGKTVYIDRQTLGAIGMGEAFTLTFQDGRLSGMGAPNRYFGPYTAYANRGLSIGDVANTLMAAFYEPDELKEREYFDYLSGVTHWDLGGGRLELYSTGNGTETILIFDLK